MISALELLDKLPLWGVLLATLVITVLSTECGYQAGRRKRLGSSEEERLRSGPFAAAVLGLLAFLLAIVYGSVESRLGILKQVALDEANAIGTVYLRADLLPTADRAEIKQVLREYVDLHVEQMRAGSGLRAEMTFDRFEELHAILWSRATALAQEQPTPITALFVASVNQMIDLSETRMTFGIHYRLPGTIWMVLYGLAILAMAMGGYSGGISDRRRTTVLPLVAALAYSVVLLLVVALDRPFHATTVTESAMLDLQESMSHSTSVQP